MENLQNDAAFTHKSSRALTCKTRNFTCKHQATWAKLIHLISIAMRACAIRRLAWIDLIPALGQMGNVGHEWCTMLRNATHRNELDDPIVWCYIMSYIYNMLFATQLQATLELKLSPHLWSLLVRKTCDILRSAPCIPDSVNADQFTIFLPPSKFSNRKGTNCAFLRSQLPWLVHGSVPRVSPSLWQQKGSVLDLGTSISRLFQILSTPMATKPLATLLDDQRCCRLCASGSSVAAEYKWFGWSVLNCVDLVCVDGTTMPPRTVLHVAVFSSEFLLTKRNARKDEVNMAQDVQKKQHLCGSWCLQSFINHHGRVL